MIEFPCHRSGAGFFTNVQDNYPRFFNVLLGFDNLKTQSLHEF